MRVLVRQAAKKQTAVILKIASYVGKDTWLAVGGPRIKEFVPVGPFGPEEGENGVMYAIAMFQEGDKTGSSDFGYVSVSEAEQTLKRTDPNAEVVVIE